MVNKSFIYPNGHQWRDADGRQRCPVCGAEVAEMIGNGNAHVESKGTCPSEAGTATADAASHSRFGRYKIIEELGRDGMGIVYRAFDPVHERQVALKTPPNLDPTLLSRFKREFRALAGVQTLCGLGAEFALAHSAPPV